MGIQRVPNLLRWTVLACCLPYPGDPKSAIDCFFLFGISLHPGVTGSAPHWKFRGCRVHSFPSPQELLRPASWLALLSRTFTFELAPTRSPSISVEYDYVDKQSIPTAGLSPASPTALWARPGESDIPLRAEPTERKSITAYQFGYNRAHQFRAFIDMQSQPIPNLAGLLHQKCGWPDDPKIILESSNATSLDALVGSDSQGYPRIVEKPGRPESHQYRLARALFFVPDVEAGITARLITRGFNWDQSASRAFAAELLAPADLLRSLVDESTTYESIGKLAQQLNVSAWVIEHQLENHGIASIEA